MYGFVKRLVFLCIAGVFLFSSIACAADCSAIDGTWQPIAEESISRFPELAKLPGLAPEALSAQLEQKRLIFNCARKRFKSVHNGFKSKEHAFSIVKVEGDKFTIKIPSLGTRLTLTKEGDKLELISPSDKYVMERVEE